VTVDPPVFAETVPVAETVFPDSDSVAVIVTVPTATPVTTPEELTVAVAELEELQVIVEGVSTVAPLASRGVTINDAVLPTAIEGAPGETVRWSMVETIVIARGVVVPDAMETLFDANA
jgi:hypothetical protein